MPNVMFRVYLTEDEEDTWRVDPDEICTQYAQAAYQNGYNCVNLMSPKGGSLQVFWLAVKED